MEGVGPTFFVELRKTIPWCLGSPPRMPYGMFDPGSTGCFGCCESNCNTYGDCGGCGGGCDSCSLGSPCFPWRFYANFRVSALWADTYSESMTESIVATGDGLVTQGIARGRDKATLGIDDEKSLVTTQIQFGLEHRTPIFCNRALWICRLGFEIQSWDTGKHESKSQSYAFLEDPAEQFGGRVETLSRADNRYLTHLQRHSFDPLPRTPLISSSGTTCHSATPLSPWTYGVTQRARLGGQTFYLTGAPPRTPRAWRR